MDSINEEPLETSRLCTEVNQTYSSVVATSPDTEVIMTGNTESGSCCASFKESMVDNPVAQYAQNFCTKKNALRKVPIVKWLPKYRLKHFVGDLVAGLTVGLTVIPQGLAYALIAELPPQYGLYSAFMGVFLYTFFGTSKDITLGPTAIMSLLIAEFGSERAPGGHHATDENKAIYAIILTLMCGLMQLAMGFLNMGFIVQFISFPVISGFTSAAAILIAFGQVRKWLGLKNVDRDFLPQVQQTFEKIPETNLWDMGFGLGCMVLLVLMKKLKEMADARMKVETNKKKKALYKVTWLICTARNAVIVVFMAVIASILLDVYGINGLSLTGKIDEGIPTPALPKFSIDQYDNSTGTHYTRSTSEIFSDIGEGFIVVALIGLLESIAIAKAFARKNEYQIDANQELIALGIANSVSCFFHSYPVTGSFSRTAINAQSGVRTPAGGIWTGALVLLSLAVLTPYFFYIPQAALAAVIICAVLQMVDYEIIITLWKVKKLDLVPLIITFLASIFGNIEYGILAGVGFSILMLIFPMARPGLKITYEKSMEEIEEGLPNTSNNPREAVVIEPNQGLKFPGIEYIKDKAMKHGAYEVPAKGIVLNARHFSGCDYTMVQGITQLCEYFSKHRLQFVIACCSAELMDVLEAAEIKGLKFADSTEEALRTVFAGGLATPINLSTGNINNGYDSSDTPSTSSSITSEHVYHKTDIV